MTCFAPGDNDCACRSSAASENGPRSAEAAVEEFSFRQQNARSSGPGVVQFRLGGSYAATASPVVSSTPVLRLMHLHRRARRALAEIVERGHGQDLLPRPRCRRPRAPSSWCRSAGRRAGTGRAPATCGRRAAAPARISRRRSSRLSTWCTSLAVDLLGGDVARDRHDHQHALGIVADRRHEQRRVLEAGVLLHLRHVLVRELERRRGRTARRRAVSCTAISSLPPPV